MFGDNVEKITLSLIDLIVKNGRESFIPAIARNFIHETKKYKGITDSILTTAVKVDDKVKKQIIRSYFGGISKQKLTLKKILILK